MSVLAAAAETVVLSPRHEGHRGFGIEKGREQRETGGPGKRPGWSKGPVS